MSTPLADDQLAEFIRAFRENPAPSAAQVGADVLRQGTLDRTAARPPGPELWRTVDLEASGVPVRVYRPTGQDLGTVVYLHGGGWVIGDLDTHDRACRRLAARSGLDVVAVDHRRAPEHPWPAAVDDAVAVLRWTAAAPDVLGAARRTAVAGDSAGGTLAALACLRLRDAEDSALPDVLALLYANTDLARSGEPPVPGSSMDTEGHGYGLEHEDITWFTAQWVPERIHADPTVLPRGLRDPAASPLFAPDLSGLPATLVVTCEHDPLRDEGEELARRLDRAGVPTTMRREPGLVHNFLLWDLVSPACAAAGDRIADDLARLLDAPAPTDHGSTRQDANG